MQKIVKRNELQYEGRMLAKNGHYEEALEKYRLAMDPAILNNEGDKSGSFWAIRNIYERQSKFDEALELNEKSILPKNPEKDSYIDASRKLRALIKARDTHDNKYIYQYVSYLRSKYGKYIPPNGYDILYESIMNDIIHLYNYLHDYDAGIAFVDEVIKYHTQHPNRSHRLANAKHVKEYTRVKEAWELDKKTGQHGHLQEVIRTSDVISW